MTILDILMISFTIISYVIFFQVKLADMLSKFIVPVSFLDYWPPKCLAIQFATTQFIPWSSSAIIKMDGQYLLYFLCRTYLVIYGDVCILHLRCFAVAQVCRMNNIALVF